MDQQTLVDTARAAGVQPFDRDPINSDNLLDTMRNSGMGMIMAGLSQQIRQIQRERKKALHDANIRENNRFCRKRCKLFKTRQCFKKTYEQQCECERTRGYEREEVIVPEVV